MRVNTPIRGKVRAKTLVSQDFKCSGRLPLLKKLAIGDKVVELLGKRRAVLETPEWLSTYGYRGRFYFERVIREIIEELVRNAERTVNEKGQAGETRFTVRKIIEADRERVEIVSRNVEGEIPDILWAVQPLHSARNGIGLGLPLIIDFTVYSFGGEAIIESGNKAYLFAGRGSKDWGEDIASIGQEIKTTLAHGTRIALRIPISD